MRAATAAAATEVGNHQHGGEGAAKTGGVRASAPWARLPLPPLLACVAPGFSGSLGILMVGAGETVLALK